MIAEEKARELVDKYLYHVESFSSEGRLEAAKTCALIAVEELIEVTYAATRSTYEYWLDVKQEIINIL